MTPGTLTVPGAALTAPDAVPVPIPVSYRLTNIIVDGVSLGQEEDLIIKCGSEIISGPEKAGHVVYTFKLMPMEQQLNKRIKVPIDIELVKCSICLNLLHDAVTVAPCLHNFCNGCFSEWMTRSLGKSQPLLCPYCRAKIYCGGRNHFLRNLEEVIQESNPSLKRSSEELTTLDSCATIKREFVTKLCRSKAYVDTASLATTNSSAYVQQCLQCDDMGS
ncbi:E3 ubiquitin-protein ligase [Nymphaea thermarum]|nr:E3 ubiquitin-protein ligase [Nymphaea thermarum]